MQYDRPFGESNDHWIRVSLDIGEEALGKALAKVGLGPKDIDTIFAISVTGVASPSLDARLANRMGFREDIKRVPIFGLGCGIMTSAIRLWGSYPEGVSFSILFMNALTPLIDRITITKPFGYIAPTKQESK